MHAKFFSVEIRLSFDFVLEGVKCHCLLEGILFSFGLRELSSVLILGLVGELTHFLELVTFDGFYCFTHVDTIKFCNVFKLQI